MAQLTKPQKRLATLAAVLGILQGTAWIVMSIICLVIHWNSNSFTLPNVSSSHMSWVEYYIFLAFLNKTSKSETTINPQSFSIFMWLTLVINFIWLVLSLIQLVYIYRVGHNVMSAINNWTAITVLISLIDLLLVILIGITYNEVCSYSEFVNKVSCAEIYIPVLVIAARGFILWIINLILAYVVSRIRKTTRTGKNLAYKLRFADPQIPRATLQRPQNNSNKVDNWASNSSTLSKNEPY